MKVTINISDKVQEAFLDNLYFDKEVVDNIGPEDVLRVIIGRFLYSKIDRDDIDMVAASYIDSIDESGELEDIMYEISLGKELPV